MPSLDDQFERAAHASLAQGDARSRASWRRPRGRRGQAPPAPRLSRSSSPKRRDAQRPGAGADGDGKPPFGARDQQEQGLGRRLFERLQQRIGGILVQFVGAVDDDHAPSRLARRMAEKGAQAPHLVDADPLRIALRLLDPGAPDQQKIRDATAPRLCGTPDGRDRWRRAARRLIATRRAPRARSDRRASPCRCPRARPAARHDACGRLRAHRRTR